MSQILLDLSDLEQLKSATSLEEVQQLVAKMADSSKKLPETPDQAYSRLRKDFEYLEGVSISRKGACEKYTLPVGTVANWEEYGLVRVIQKAKRRGLHTYINERDVAVMDAMNKLYRKGPGGPIRGWKPQIAILAS